MIELLQIFLFFIIFIIVLFLPLNIFEEKKYSRGLSVLDKSSMNLAINLNFLLLISFLNYPLELIQPILLVFYSLFFLFNCRNQLLQIKNFLIKIIPLFIIFFILSVNISGELFLGWDAKYFNYIKTLYFIEDKTIFDLNAHKANVYHPYFGSYLWAFFWAISPTDTEYFGRLFYLFLFSYSLFFVSQIAENKIINTLIFIFLIFIFYEYKYFSGLHEILIFSFLVLISKFFYEVLKSKDYIYIILILLFSNLFIWIKAEGIVYFLLVLFLFTLIKRISIKTKFLIFLTLTLLYFVKIIVFDMANIGLNSQGHIYNLEYLANLKIEVFLHKIFNISIWFAYYVLTNIFFITFILVIIFEFLYAKKKQTELNYNKLLFFYLAYILVYIFAAYVLRDMEIIYAIRTTMDRLLMTASGFFVYPCIKKLSEYPNLLRKNK